MKLTRTITALLACSVVAVPAFASDIVQKLFPKNAVQQQAKAAPHAASSDFTDFSGTWKGFCTYMGFRFPLDLTLANTARYLRIDGMEYGIGELDTHTATSARQSIANHTAVEWNADMTHLVFRNVVFGKELAESSEVGSTAFDLGINHFTFAMDKEALTIHGYSISFSDLAPNDETVALDCTLNHE